MQRNPQKDALEYSAAARWQHPELFDDGYVMVPTQFLELYSQLRPSLTPGEVMLVLQLMSFKWSRKAPYPSYSVLSRRMGVTDKAVRRIAAALESKGYLRRIVKAGTTNQFDLSKLFDALQKKQAENSRRLQEMADYRVRGGRQND